MKIAVISFLLTAFVFLVCWWKFWRDLQAAWGMAALLLAYAMMILNTFAVATSGSG